MYSSSNIQKDKLCNNGFTHSLCQSIVLRSMGYQAHHRARLQFNISILTMIMSHSHSTMMSGWMDGSLQYALSSLSFKSYFSKNTMVFKHCHLSNTAMLYVLYVIYIFCVSAQHARSALCVNASPRDCGRFTAELIAAAKVINNLLVQSYIPILSR